MPRAAARRAGVLGVLSVLALGLTGCTESGDTTCEEFNAQSIGEQTKTLTNLLSEHSLETADVGNMQGVSAAVTNLCSSDPSAELNTATDWDSDTW